MKTSSSLFKKIAKAFEMPQEKMVIPKEQNTITQSELRRYLGEKETRKKNTNAAYGNVIQRRVTVGGQEFFSRSSWEENYARYLEFQKKNGVIIGWSHEPTTFNFPVPHGITSYLPDFMVVTKDGATEFHEVKGRMMPGDKTKLNRMKKFHPLVKMVLIDKPRYLAIEKTAKRMIKDWA